MKVLVRTLRDAIYKRGLSIAETARVCGLAPEHTWAIATGAKVKHAPTVRTLHRLETGLGLQCGELFAAVCEDLDMELAGEQAEK